MPCRRVVAVLLFGALFHQADLRAIKSLLDPPDMERALALARSSDTARARFHAGYFAGVHAPAVEYFTVEQVEVITEFRRLELIGEEHARLNDLFARAGLRDAEEALRPWRGHVSLVAHLKFDPAAYIAGVPALDLTLEESSVLHPIEEPRRTGIYSGGDTPSLIGGLVEAVFDARAVGQKTWPIVVAWKTRPLVDVPIDFSALE